MEDEFIVQKPQFDVSKLHKGKALSIYTDKFTVANSYSWHGIIVAYGPLDITVTYYNNELDDEHDIEIPMSLYKITIQEVTNGDIKIKQLYT